MDAPDARRAPDVPSRFHVDFQGRTLLGTYRVDRRLAEGGMGAVYLAHDQNLGRRVVVKVPHVRFLAEPGFRARFRREIAELVRLEHPSIVRILAQGEEDEIPFFVLQYLGGGSLEDRIARGHSTPDQVLPWLARVAETLDYVHGQGVVHRDVKPGNILFDEQGHAFLSDFGVVKALEPAGGAELTDAGTGIGSPIYMAPEQALGKTVGPAADQFALASTAYEALTGEPPFGRGSAVEVILAKARGTVPPPRDKAPNLPAACERAVLRAMATEPDQRFPGCVAFADAFRAGLAAAATQAIATPPRPRSAAVPALAAVGLLAVAGLAYLATRPGPPAPTPPAASARLVDETPNVLLRLARPGAEPRALLRVTPAPDMEDATTLTLVQTLARTVDDRPEVSSTHRIVQEAKVTVERTGPEGATLRWSFSVPKTELVGGGPDAATQNAFNALGRGLGTSVLTARGVATNLTLRHEGKGAGVAEARAGLDEMVKMLCVTLPAEPVGVGAEWDATELLEVAGVRYQQTLTCRLVARDGDRVTLRGEVRFASPPQRMDAPPGDAVKSFALTAISGEGSMDVVLDLRRPLPISMTTKGLLTFTATAAAEGTTHAIRFRKTYETDLRGK